MRFSVLSAARALCAVGKQKGEKEKKKVGKRNMDEREIGSLGHAEHLGVKATASRIFGKRFFNVFLRLYNNKSTSTVHCHFELFHCSSLRWLAWFMSDSRKLYKDARRNMNRNKNRKIN